MQSCGEFLEMYKVDKTFRVKSPESIDPEETNPNAMWVTSPTDDVWDRESNHCKDISPKLRNV